MKEKIFSDESKISVNKSGISKFYKSKLCNIKVQLRTVFTGVCISAFALVWWCVLYPELCFPKDTYETVYESEEGIDGSDTETCGGLLQADEGQIIVKSRLLEALRRKRK